ncbi:hypothetical protein [Paractinoplanes ferrugineus]|uniref:hypothetical protein n=1 Tax=Paractinoplanes ferrugineus TaxID=113564 RepID=UPI0019436C95|nr:hypothetical protein [Actinoplanes ferrugineus]
MDWIVTALHELGCDDPQGWGKSEISENIPQLARYRFLQNIWPETINGWRDGISNLPAAQRAINSGASAHDVAQLARAVAYETAFAMLAQLTVDNPGEGLPGWALAGPALLDSPPGAT